MTKYKLSLMWSLIFFTVTLLWVLFEKAMGFHGEKIHLLANYSLIYDLLFVGVYFLAFRDWRNHLVINTVSWKQGAFFGMTITIMVTCLSPVVQTITHTLISPELFSNIIKLAVDNNLMTEVAAQAKFNLGNYIQENIIGTFALGSLCSLIYPLLFKLKKAQKM